MGFLRPLESFPRIFQRLLGELVPSEVVSLLVGRGGGKVGVLGELMKFSSSLMRIVWHGVSCPRRLIHLKPSLNSHFR